LPEIIGLVSMFEFLQKSKIIFLCSTLLNTNGIENATSVEFLVSIGKCNIFSLTFDLK